MKLKFTKQMFLLTIRETKNKHPEYRWYDFFDEEVGDTIALIGPKMALEAKKDYEVDLTLTLEKKTLTEAGKKNQYDIAKLFLEDARLVG